MAEYSSKKSPAQVKVTVEPHVAAIDEVDLHRARSKSEQQSKDPVIEPEIERRKRLCVPSAAGLLASEARARQQVEIGKTSGSGVDPQLQSLSSHRRDREIGCTDELGPKEHRHIP